MERSETRRRAGWLAMLTYSVRACRRAGAALHAWWRVNRDARTLLNEPDYRLKDIGITRAEIEFRLRGDRYL